MSPLLARVKIRTRILFLAALPLLALAVVAAFLFDRERTVARETGRIARIVALGPDMGALVHELQKERGMSAGFIGSDGARFGEELPRQRAATDAAFAALRNALARTGDMDGNSGFLRDLAEDLARLEALPELRRKVDVLATDLAGMVGIYTGFIRHLLDTTRAMIGIATDPAMIRAITGHVHLLEAKELAGQARALGTVGFGRGRFDAKLYNGFLRRLLLQERHLEEARFWADAEMGALLERLVRSAPFAEVSRLRGIVTASLGAGDLGAVTGEEWFAAMTRKIDAMKEVEDRFVALLATRADALAEAAATDARRFGALALLALVLILLLAGLVSRSITAPLAALVAKTSRLAEGDTSIEIVETGRRDEIGVMAKALERFREIREKSDREEKRRAIRARRLEELMGRFGDRIGEVVATLVDTTTGLDGAAEDMARTARSSRANAAAIGGSAEQASAEVQAMAAAVQELSASVAEIAARADRSSTMAGGAVEDAAQARRVAGELAEATRRIEEVLGLISSITEQTHMLALNATIEAARAGEVGRGFAVVAGEVKNLAGATADATEKVRALVENIGRATGEVVAAVERVHGVLSELDEAAGGIAGATEEQNAAVREMARSAEKAATETARATTSIGELREAADLTDGAAGRVREAVTVVARRTAELRDCVEDFLAGIRAA